MTTSGRSRPIKSDSGHQISTSSPLVTPANPLAMPESGGERMTPGTSGLGFENCLPLSVRTSRAGACLRTLLGTSHLGSTVCSLTWRMKATPAGRPLFRLQASVRSTGGIGSGLWPTATVVTRPNEGSVRMYRQKVTAGELSEAEAEAILGKSVWEAQGKLPARMFMTPKAGDAEFQTPRTSGRPPEMSTHLATQVVFNPPEMWLTAKVVQGRNETAGRSNSNSKHHTGTTLNDVVYRIDPKARLNPDFVERLMGFPPGWTVLSTSSDAAGSTACH